MGIGIKSHVGTMQAKAHGNGARAWNGNAAPKLKTVSRRVRSKKMVTEMWGDEPYTFYPLGKNIVADPEICRGRPTFKYTRIDVELVLEGLAHGMTVAQIAHMYRLTKVTEEGIREAVHLAAKLLNQAFSKKAFAE